MENENKLVEVNEQKDSSIPVSPAPTDTTSDSTLSDETNLKQDNIETSYYTNEHNEPVDVSETKNDEQNDNSNLITKSTVVISSSQIIEDDMNSIDKSCVDLSGDFKKSDDDDEQKNNVELVQSIIEETVNESIDKNIQSIIGEIVSYTSSTENNDNQNQQYNDNQIDQQNKLETQELEPTQKQNDDVDNLVKDYEIPNFTIQQQQHEQTQSQNTEQEGFTDLNRSEYKIDDKEIADLPRTEQDDFQKVDSETESKKEDTSDTFEKVEINKDTKPESNSIKKIRRLEDEVYEKPLGSDSLLKKIIQYGEEDENGRGLSPRNGQMCTISYEAFLKDSNKLVEQNDNLSFILGDGDVVPALDLVVSLMDKNEKCEVIAEARHAYGSIGKEPDIPSNSTLVYKIHLKNFEELIDMNSMEPVQRLSLAEAKKLRGNFHFNRKDFHSSISSYRKGLRYFDEDNLKGDEETNDLKKFLELRQALLMNTALSYYKLSDFRSALGPLDDVIKTQSKHMKALYIKGKVLMQLGETKEAIDCLTKASELDQNNAEIKNELTKAQVKHKVQYENEKKMYQKMMSGVSSDKNNKRKSTSSNKKASNSSNLLTYVAGGLAVAAASIGIALFAKYRNLI